MDFPDKYYDMFMFPFEKFRLGKMRKSLIHNARGKVLELGAGTGVNFNYYKIKQLSSLTIMDLSITETVNNYNFKKELPVRLLEGNVMDLPFKSQSFDTVVFTLLFCSVENPVLGLKEVNRILRPGGQLLFIEHVLPNKKPFDHIFHKLNPHWLKLSKSCHLNRDTFNLINESGFEIRYIRHYYKGALICGVARKL